MNGEPVVITVKYCDFTHKPRTLLFKVSYLHIRNATTQSFISGSKKTASQSLYISELLPWSHHLNPVEWLAAPMIKWSAEEFICQF